MKTWLRLKWDLILTCAVLGVWLTTASPWVRAKDLTPEQAHSVYTVAYGQCPKLAGMKDGCPPEWLEKGPAIQIVHPQYLCGRLDTAPVCNVQGLYVGDMALFLSSALDFDTPFGASTLLHEYLHHFQWLRDSGQGPATCEAGLALEADAYSIQAYVLEQTGDYRSATEVRRSFAQLRCR